MTKKSRQKFKYLENEKSFQYEVKSIFHHFWKVFIEANKKIFWKVRVWLWLLQLTFCLLQIILFASFWFASKSLTLCTLLVFFTFKLFLFWIFPPPLKWWFSSLNRWLVVSILTKCYLMSFINTSFPSDNKPNKTVTVQLIHVYSRFFSTE